MLLSRDSSPSGFGRALGLIIGLISAGGVCASAAKAAPPNNLMPAAVYGVGLNVSDLEGERAWYESRLGMTVLASNKAADGSSSVYIMGYAGNPAAPIVALQKRSTAQARSSASTQIILWVPEAKGLADWLKEQGVQSVEVRLNTNYLLTDPEGNSIVLLYAGPATAAAAAAPTSGPCGSGPTRSRLLDAALAMMRDANPFEYERSQDMYRQGLSQQSVFDEEYARCLRSNPAR